MTIEPEGNDNYYLPPQEWGKKTKLLVGHILVKCIGGCMDGETVDVGVGGLFFRALSGGPLATGDKGYLPERPVHSYRLIKQHKTGESVFALESLLVPLLRLPE